MIDTIAIVVFDRFHNLVKWFDILKQCTYTTKVVVIHNTVASNPTYKNLCEANNAIYIARPNVGFDIGAFQDVCRNRLPGFPDWKQLFWATDDTFPIRKYFLDYYALREGEGVRATDISPYARTHVRTTGFSVARQVANSLKFPADPVMTKQHCYMFEHRQRTGVFMQQVLSMGLRVQMVAPRESSPVFDTGYHRKLPREKEFNAMWGFDQLQITVPVLDNTVTIICPIYKSFPAVISSLIMQTFKNWKLILVHDGPGNGEVKSFVELINDDRIEYLETDSHAGNWGHTIRAQWLQKVTTKYVVITNPDNYYAPPFLERAVSKLHVNGAVAAYSEAMVHNYLNWRVITCKVKRGYIDCGGVVLKTKEAQAVGWRNVTDHSADWFFFNDIANRYGLNKFVPIIGTLLVHN